MSGRAISVALPLPVQSAFSYALPEGAPRPERGARVLVPFGRRRVIGIVTSAAAETAGLVLKDVLEVLDEAPLPPPPLLDLADWMAEHYLAPPGECHRLVLPPAGIRASRAVARLVAAAPQVHDVLIDALRPGPLRVSTLARRVGGDPSARLARLRKAGIVEIEQDLTAAGFRRVWVAVLTEPEAVGRGTAQAEALQRLRRAGGRAPVAELVRDRPTLRGAIDRLGEKGVLRIEEERDIRTPDALPAPPS